MNTIVFSYPGYYSNEAAVVNELFENGLHRFHIRKNNYTEEELKALIDKFDNRFRKKISLHSHHHLAADYGIGGIHFKEAERKKLNFEEIIMYKNENFLCSTSIHDQNDFSNLKTYFDYIVYGPVFNSISKVNHAPQISFQKVSIAFNNTCELYAVGGIKKATIALVNPNRFSGVVLLGAIWDHSGNEINNYIQCLQPENMHFQ